MSPIAVLVLAFIASCLAAHASPLNAAIIAAIDTMNKNGFLDAQYTKFIKLPVTPVPDDCDAHYPPANLLAADTDLYRVLNTGRARVGFPDVAVADGFIFQDANGVWTGTEVEEAREAFRLIGAHYGVKIEVVFVSIKTVGGYQNTVKTGLNSYAVDLMWARTSITEERKALFDFTCTNFKTILRLGARAGAQTAPPAGTVGCIVGSIFCDVTLPAGLTFQTFEKVADYRSSITNAPTGATADYIIESIENLNTITTAANCPGCSVVPNIDLLTIQQSPVTRKFENPAGAVNIVESAGNRANALAAYAKAWPKSTKEVEVEGTAALKFYRQACEFTIGVQKACIAAVNKAFSAVFDLSTSSSSSSSSHSHHH